MGPRFQHFGLSSLHFLWLADSARDVEYGLKLQGMKKSARRKISDLILKQVGLAESLPDVIKGSSGGMSSA